MDVADHVICPKCGYDLFGIPERCCPECGFAYDGAAIRMLAIDEGWDELKGWLWIIVRCGLALVAIIPVLVARLDWGEWDWLLMRGLSFVLLIGAVCLYDRYAPPVAPTWLNSDGIPMFWLFVWIGSGAVVLLLAWIGRWVGTLLTIWAWMPLTRLQRTSPFAERSLSTQDQRLLTRERRLAIVMLAITSVLAAVVWL